MSHVTHREHTQANLSISQRLRTYSQALRLRRSAFHFIFSPRRPFYRYRQSCKQPKQYVNTHGPRGFSAPAHQEPSVRCSAMVSTHSTRNGVLFYVNPVIYSPCQNMRSFHPIYMSTSPFVAFFRPINQYT